MTPEHRALIQRLLFLAQEAVKAAIDEHFDDPDDYFICRELAELEPMVSKALKEPSAVLTRWGRPAIKPVPSSDNSDYRENWDIKTKDGSLCFASAIYARLVGGEQDEAELQWLAEYLRANSAIKPVPVSERPWEREGWCDAEGKCWICGNVEGDWRLMNPRNVPQLKYCFSHTLPHNALPVPEVTP